IVSFFFIDTPPAEIYTLSLHDALPILCVCVCVCVCASERVRVCVCVCSTRDRKSTRLNSSHTCISYAVFCLKNIHTRTHTHIQTCRHSAPTAHTHNDTHT